MDEYSKEIRDLEVQVEQLFEAEEQPETIAELEIQINVLKALYARARELLERGWSDAEMRQALTLRGYGDWSLDNVYTFVYEASVDVPAEGPHEFLDAVRDIDFATVLEAPLKAG